LEIERGDREREDKDRLGDQHQKDVRVSKEGGGTINVKRLSLGKDESK
jgi:hypothetical protein